jgi:hypothetical protein
MAVGKVTLDKDKFDQFQIEMVTAIIGTIVRELGKANLPNEQFKDLATGIAFHVCCILDASQPFGNEEDDIFPVITFQAEGYAEDEVISCGGGSYMHEYVHGLVDACFQPRITGGDSSGYIAQRDLVAVKSTREEHVIEVRVGKPYQCATGEWACPVALNGLYANLRDQHGDDSFQALMLAQRLARNLLNGFIEDGGELLDASGGSRIDVERLFGTGVYS